MSKTYEPMQERMTGTLTTSTLVVDFAPSKKGVAAGRLTAGMLRTGTGFPHLPNSVLEANPRVLDLLEMLTYMRPAGAVEEDDYIARYIDVLPGVKVDAHGNRWVIVGTAPEIMWSSHTDTVHRAGGMQEVRLQDGFAYVPASNCLGADDTCGNWLMIEMIRAQVPGIYIFHRDEEVGGYGSLHIATHYEDEIKAAGIRACIAFDRKGYDSVITHQAGGRCCSDVFGHSLARLLGGYFALDDGGTFTDSANYTDVIGECTNLSIGYHGAHGPAECTNVAFLVGLRDVMVSTDWSKLQFHRNAGDPDPDAPTWDRWDAFPSRRTTADDYTASDMRDMLQLVNADPGLVAKFILDMGYTPEDIDEHGYADHEAAWDRRDEPTDWDANDTWNSTSKGRR